MTSTSHSIAALTEVGPPGVNQQSRQEYQRRIEEFGQVVHAYSELVEKLEHSQHKLSSRVAQLQEELGEKQRLLERRNRLAALGEMAAGLAHEIRNPLGAIRLYTSLLRSDLADRPQSNTTCEKISTAISRLELIVTQVLHFSRDLRVTLAPCDLATVIREAVETASARFADRVAFATRVPHRLPANADANMLGQALLNLLLNAAEAIEGPGKVTLTAGIRARRITLRITDTGPGIDPQVIDRIFNPFFTTKDTGTGLGLAIVHRIVEAHEGSIRAGNQQSRGAIFDISLPCHIQSPPGETESPPGHAEGDTR